MQIMMVFGSAEIIFRVWVAVHYPLSVHSHDVIHMKWKIDIQFEGLENGEYKLLLLGTDVANNTTSDELLVYSFSVVNEKEITHIYPVPNPFKEYCRFKFDITGNAIPEDVNIYIFSTTGVLVKTITMNDLGDIKVGENISSYQYYGTDESGEELPNGLYYYRIIFDFGETGLKYKETNVDFYEDKVGKLMIVR